jgi:hypothetical protein
MYTCTAVHGSEVVISPNLQVQLSAWRLQQMWYGTLRYINVNICNRIRERCNDIERQNIFSDVNVKISLSFYCEMTHEWGKGRYIEKRTRKERMGIIWW